jgi:hypothetical protein
MKITSILLCFCILLTFAQFASAQTTVTFKVKTLVSDGKKSKQNNSTIKFLETSFSNNQRRKGVIIQEFNYTDIIAADYSYSEKPVLSSGGAIAATLLFGALAIPFLFMKKKEHWLSVRTNDDYLVMKLNRSSYKKILNEFAAHKVEVKNIDEDSLKVKY